MSRKDSVALFYEDPYLTNAQASIIRLDHDDRGDFAVLESTIFYPQGGGQKGDRGRLGGAEVLETRRADGEIRHYLRGAPEATGELVQSLDWAFRYHQMKLHSAAHFLHCALERITGSEIPYPIRAPLTETVGECHYEFVNRFTTDDLKAATEFANDFMAEGHEITTHAEEERGPGMRSWRCEGLYIACGGLHPRDSREVGVIAGRMTQKRGKTLLTFWLDQT